MASLVSEEGIVTWLIHQHAQRRSRHREDGLATLLLRRDRVRPRRLRSANPGVQTPFSLVWNSGFAPIPMTPPGTTRKRLLGRRVVDTLTERGERSRHGGGV